MAVERIFFQNNVRTAMSVGQASGLATAVAVAPAHRWCSTRPTR
ncbi:MAG: crossover junction endodeoxyribonuclease RuvC [Acidimicrobiales bacterium]